MKKIVFLLCLLCPIMASAEEITEKEAYEKACEFFDRNLDAGVKSKSKNVQSVRSEVRLALKAGGQDAPLYVFNRGDEDGFVIVAGDDRLEKCIVGWSDTGSLDEKTMPEGLKWLLSEYEHELKSLDEASTGKKLRHASAVAGKEVKPLLKTKWSQAEPFNQMLPEGFHVTGCVPTAMAQIMNYWEWPKRGRGSHTNRTTPDNWEQLLHEGRFEELKAGKVIASVDFSKSEYDWTNIIDSYYGTYTDAQANAVAKLMLDCLTASDAVNMDSYGFSVGAYPEDAVTAMVRYFSYSPKWEVVSGAADSLIVKELDEGRPVLYDGNPKKGNGHVFVCDGYNADGYFHFNFGWTGGGDGYYLTSLINPLDHDFSYNTYAIIGIQPSKTTFEKENIYYDLLDAERACVVYANNATADIKESVDYESKTYTVTKIAARAFYNTDVEITQVSLPATIDTIGAEAFLFADIKTLNIGSVEMWNNVYMDGEWANPASIGSLRNYMIGGQPMTDLVVPSSVGKVRPHLFPYSTTLQHLTFENGITEIGDSAFIGCENLESIELPHTHVAIGAAAFANGYNNSKLTDIGALNMATQIGDMAFAYCPITSIQLSDSLTSVGNGAFRGHNSDYINLPASLNRIGRAAFLSDDLYGFRDEEESNTSYSIHGDALYNKEGTRLLQVPVMVRNSNGYGKRYEFGVLKTTRTIAADAFQECRGIKKVIIPASVTDIEQGAFLSLDELADMTNYATTPQTIDEGTFADSPFEYTDVNRRAKLHVLQGCGELYAAASGWNRFNIVEDLPAGSQPDPGYDGELNANGFVLTYRVPDVGQEELRCLFSDNPVLTTDSKGLVVTTDKIRLSVQWGGEDCLLEELVFTELDDPTGIEEIKVLSQEPVFIFEGNSIRVIGQQPNTVIKLYSIDGREQMSVRTSDKGEAKIVLSEHDKNVYVLRAGNQSIKIQIQ